MEELNPHLLEADLVAFASPIYYYDWSAQLKLAIDRFYANSTALRTPKGCPAADHGGRHHGVRRRRGPLLPGHDQ
ncbi:MAG: NAD(P)H-dependent oxidoreductase [Evtepia gabavorous]